MDTKIIEVELPEDLAASVAEILVERQLELNDLVRLYLRSFVIASRRFGLLKLTDEMPFGKYRGETLEIIIRTDPHYVSWMIDNNDTFRVDQTAMALIAHMQEDEDNG